MENLREDDMLVDAARVASLLEVELDKKKSEKQSSEIPQNGRTKLQQSPNDDQSVELSSITVQKHEEGQVPKEMISQV